MMKWVKIIGGLLVLVLVLVVAFGSGGGPKAPSKPTTPYKTIPTSPAQNDESPTTSTTSTGTTPSSGGNAPNFSTGGGGSSSASAPPALSNSTQGVDAQDKNPAVVKAQKQVTSSHPIFQKLPITESGVTLDVGAFGTAQQPGISVTYSTSQQQAHDVVARVFAQYHDSETDYEIHYSGG